MNEQSPYEKTSLDNLEQRENAAISQINVAYQQFALKYHRNSPEIPREELMMLLQSMIPDQETQTTLQAEIVKSVYKGEKINSPIDLTNHLVQTDIPYPSIPAGRVSTCVLATVTNALRAYETYDPQRDTEENLLREIDPKYILADGEIIHREPTEYLLAKRGFSVKETNNLMVITQALRKGNMVSLNQNNRHIVLMSGLTSDPSTGELIFRINDPGQETRAYISTQQAAHYVSDWRFPTAVVISRDSRK